MNKNMLEFMDQETADVVFEVGDQQVGEQQLETSADLERTEGCITSFHAHRPILQKCAPTLWDVWSRDRGEITAVSITDVKPEIFRHMIYYTYGGKLSEDELKNNAKDIINGVISMG